MKSLTRVSYARRIDRALDLLRRSFAEPARGEPPSNDRLAAAASMSPFHFQRVYRLMTGETPAGTVQRLRLLLALQEIENKGSSATNAAMAAGYSSSQALAKALKNHCGRTMTELKCNPDQLAAEIARLSKSNRSEERSPTAPLTIAVESIEPFEVIALHNVGPYEYLANGYGKLFSIAGIAENLEHLVGIYGVPYDDRRFDPSAECRFDCCAAIGRPLEIPAGLRRLRLAGGPHLRIRHQGPYAGLETITDAAYVTLMSSPNRRSWTFADKSVFHHYINDPEGTAEKDLLTDVFIPLQAIS